MNGINVNDIYLCILEKGNSLQTKWIGENASMDLDYYFICKIIKIYSSSMYDWHFCFRTSFL